MFLASVTSQAASPGCDAVNAGGLDYSGATTVSQSLAVNLEFYAGDRLDYSLVLNSAKAGVVSNLIVTDIAVYSTVFGSGQSSQAYSHSFASRGMVLVTAGHADATAAISPRTATLTVTCTPGPTPVNLSLSASPATTVFGQMTTLTANLTAASGTPSGSVIFSLDGVDQAPVAISGGSASLAVSTFAVGGHTVSASYAGGGGFSAASGSLSGGISVSKASTTNTVSATPDPATFGDTLTFTATISAIAP